MSQTMQVVSPALHKTTAAAPSAAADTQPEAAPAELLSQARTAWRQKHSAEATLARLRRYSKPNHGMKIDENIATLALREANATLMRILRS